MERVPVSKKAVALSKMMLLELVDRFLRHIDAHFSLQINIIRLLDTENHLAGDIPKNRPGSGFGAQALYLYLIKCSAEIKEQLIQVYELEQRLYVSTSTPDKEAAPIL